MSDSQTSREQGSQCTVNSRLPRMLGPSERPAPLPVALLRRARRLMLPPLPPLPPFPLVGAGSAASTGGTGQLVRSQQDVQTLGLSQTNSSEVQPVMASPPRQTKGFVS